MTPPRLIFLVVCLFISFASSAGILTDPRQCGFVPRDASGDIKRSSAAVSAFRTIHPCPSTGLKTGVCLGWSVDHTIPLSCGGCDAPHNMSWIPNRAKSCNDNWCKDRYERQIQYVDQAMPGINSKGCSPKLLTEEYFNN